MLDERQAPAGGRHSAEDRGPRRAAAGPLTRPQRLAPAAALAAPPAITAVLAALPAVVDLPGPDLPFPAAALLIVAVQVGGVFLARELELPTWGRVWLLMLAATAALLPMLALQTATSRVPFVALGRGSAGPLIWSTVGAVLMVVGVALLAAIVSADAPDQASILFVPAALLVPAVLGAPGDLDETAALLALAEASGLAALAAMLGWLLPAWARPQVASVALGAQFIGLWLLDYAPSFPLGYGRIVPVLATLLLVVSILATVLVPLVARGVGLLLRGVRAAGPNEKAPGPESG